MNTEYTGKIIAELRKAKGLTQKELAAKLHITDKAVSKWERGVNFPDLGLIENLAKELDTTPSMLLGLEDASKEEIMTSVAEISGQQSEDAEKDIQKIGWLNLFAGIFLIIFMYFINIKLQRNGLFFESKSLLWLIYGLIGVITVGAVYTLKKYKAIKKWETLDIVLTELLVADVAVFLAIQFFTGRNPNYIVSSILIGIASVCIQFVFYRVMKPQFMKALPMVGMTCWACWGILLKLSASMWANFGIGNLLVYNILPFACSLLTWLVCRKHHEEKEKGFYYSPNNTHKTFQSADIDLNVNKDLADWYGEGDNWGKSMRMIEKWFWFEANF